MLIIFCKNWRNYTHYMCYKTNILISVKRKLLLCALVSIRCLYSIMLYIYCFNILLIKRRLDKCNSCTFWLHYLMCVAQNIKYREAILHSSSKNFDTRHHRVFNLAANIIFFRLVRGKVAVEVTSNNDDKKLSLNYINHCDHQNIFKNFIYVSSK